MKTDFSALSDEALQAEARRIGDCLTRAQDTFARMLLGGRLKAIYREIQDRLLWRIAK